MANTYNSRSKNWFLCVFEGAECFKHLSSIIERQQNCSYAYIFHDKDVLSLLGDGVEVRPRFSEEELSKMSPEDRDRCVKEYSQYVADYSEKELSVMSSKQAEYSKKVGKHILKEKLSDGSVKYYELKRPHFHIVLHYENQHSFSSISRMFKGANIQECHSLADASAYLLHKTPTALAENKHEYDFEEIKTNDPVSVKSWLGDKCFRLRTFNRERILEYILFDNMRSISQFYMAFGSTIQQSLGLIKELLRECENVKDIPSQCKDIELNNELLKEGVEDITQYSVNHESTCTRVIELFGVEIPLAEYILRYQKWEYMDYDFLEYFKENDNDTYMRFDLEQYEGLGISYFKQHLIESRTLAIY